MHIVSLACGLSFWLTPLHYQIGLHLLKAAYQSHSRLSASV